MENSEETGNVALTDEAQKLRTEQLIAANKQLAFQNLGKDKRAEELLLANKEKDKRAEELILANREKDKRAEELILANSEKDKRADELILANREKDKRADELILANREKDKRADELTLANREKDKRADELILANREKDKRADELLVANLEKDRRADELILANKEKDKRADNLVLANKELALQNAEKDKRADELLVANLEKDRRADELILANKEKDKRADELVLANREKDKRAKELYFAEIEKSSRANELWVANKEKDRREDALDAFKEKSRLFAMMSHEMRTPLNGIISAIQLLDDGQLSSEQQVFLDAARISGDILLGHINDVLTIERKDNKELKPLDLRALILDTIASIVPTATTSGVVIDFDSQGLDDRLIVTDHRAVQQILMNLLSNAIKFTAGGNVKVKAAYGQFENGKPAVYLEVIDNGCGIAPENIDRIFDNFTTLDSSYERQSTGAGMGLWIAFNLAQHLGGDVRCVSELGHGSRFIVRFMATPVEEQSLLSTATKHGLAVKRHLLVVDDNEINRILLQALLRRRGYRVTLAKGGREAVDLADKIKFDAILMDISMPIVNGIQATREILSGDGPNTKTPIIAVTAHSSPEERTEYKAAGMSGFFQKPPNMDLLDATLLNLYSSDSEISFLETE